MPEDAVQQTVEVFVGRVGHGNIPFGEKIRFKGRKVGSYQDPSAPDDPDKAEKVTMHTLYRCPGGYRVYREEYTIFPEEKERYRGGLPEKRKRYRIGRGKEGHNASLLPTVEEGSDSGSETRQITYGIYSEEEARRTFWWLFSAVGPS